MDKPLDTILATVVNWAGDAIEITDDQARIILVNKAFETMTGYTLTEVKGRTPAEFLRSDHQDPAVYEEMWATVMNKNAWTGCIMRKTRNGEHRPFEITVAPCLEPDGSVHHMITISREVGEKYLEEERKVKLSEQVAYLQKMESLGRMAGRFAHDFNNLLTIIHGNVDLALAEASESTAEFLNDALKATNRATDLTNQMLTYAGGGATVMKNLVLNRVIKEAESLLRVTLPQNTRLTLNLQETQPQVVGDETQISQILLNLINNAAEAIGKKPGSILITTGNLTLKEQRCSQLIAGQKLPAGNYVQLMVTDDGPGIPKSVIPKIFDPFFSSKRGGHGLGLSSVLGIVKSHGGDIRVKSTQGKGARISILFPAAEPQPASQVSEPSAETKKLALVVDDDLLVRRVFAKGLEMINFNTLQACDGVEGWAIYQEQYEAIDLVVLDMKMPNMDGSTLFRLINKMCPHQKVIACSGFRDSEQEFKGGPAPDQFLVKPFTIKQLSEIVRELLP